MPAVEESVVIARPPEEVFDFLSKFENLALYDPFVRTSAQVGDGPVGLGTRGRGKSSYMGQSSDWTVEYTEFDPPRRMVSRSVEGRRDVTVTFRFQPVNGGTRVTELIEVRSGLGFLDKLPDRLVSQVLGWSLRSNLKNLANWLTEHSQA
ncbi:SRPBCC family protein [Arthrobacter sp. M2012083]|uniref:SRPBCC family protein n=1 Tax=Arthrobacter sp. M2012083 TaxID=1197706 RepID=UPI0003173357|nr:SRPBCC family protein [Arthrobacter sp. M2012083]